MINGERLVYLSRAMKNSTYKPIWIILPIVVFVLSTYSSAEQKQIELKNAEAYESRGVAYLEMRQYDKAIVNLNKALKMNPRDAYAHCNRGRSYAEQGLYDLAIHDYTKAIEINPKYEDAYFGRGLAFDAKGQYDLAISDYTKALEINPGDAGTYYARGFTYHLKREYLKALIDIKKAESLGYPIHPKILNDLVNDFEAQDRRKNKALSSN